jgi:hybrid cluster-associated redox disulfide protein
MEEMTGTSEPITTESLVQDIVQEHPQAILVFARHRMGCAGCYIAPFHTVADSAREHHLSVEPLLEDLNRALTED